MNRNVPRPGARIARAAGAAVLSVTVAAWVWSLAGVSVIQGASMAPAFVPGDVIVFERVVRGVEPGDVVVFPRPGWPGGVAHRVVRVSRAGVVRTKGDANPAPDRDPVLRAALSGRVIARLPSGALARALARRLHRWYSDVPIAQQAMTEMRPAP
jgi:signal peptidase I